MKIIKIASTEIEASRIALGCMTMGRKWNNEPVDEITIKEAMASIRTALDNGINFFDHADIYTRGKSEQIFSNVWTEIPHLREKIYIQSKCGIRFAGTPDVTSPGRYDFSYSHIISSVDGILSRLKTDYLDVLLLHRPDPLVEPEEVAKAFDELLSKGKVNNFGVSNHTGMQISLLKKYVRQPIIVNQLELNIIHNDLINAGVITNQINPSRIVRGEGTLEYCRLHDITVQAWSPLAKGLLTGKDSDLGDIRVKNAAEAVKRMALEKNTSPEAIAISWLLKHPARIQPVIGTTNLDRINACCQADMIDLTREEWYSLFIAGRGEPMP
ncbi:MAG: aldo/keto reductase [Methanococcaceae archaeon]